MFPDGHEGPYNLNSIEQRCNLGHMAPEVKIWAEGLNEPVSAATAFRLAQGLVQEIMDLDLPSLPVEEDSPPPTPTNLIQPSKSKRVPIFFVVVILGLLGLFLFQWIKSQQDFEIRRHPKMSVDLHQTIQKQSSVTGWDSKIFFREYVSADLSHIWLVNSGFQTCQVEASFKSIEGKILSLKDDVIAFKTSGMLESHVVEFSSFDFQSGSKIIPGMYELEVNASDCSWSSLTSQVMNLFRPAEKMYMARMKVILYPKGAIEFKSALDGLLNKKLQRERESQNQKEMFWQELQQKFQTLLAVSIQIEQQFLEFLDRDPKLFKKSLKPTIEIYTKKYGLFLTNFLNDNKQYFSQLDEVVGRSKQRNYELLVKVTSKKLGLESMKLIEELQKMNSPKKKDLLAFKLKTKKVFAKIKSDLNQKIIQVSEDRSH
jgi:hypothetical protein